MAKVSLVLTGSRRLNRKLEKLKSAEAKKIIRTAARESLRPTLAAAKSNAPRDTGRLAKAIKIKALARSRSRVGARVTIGSKANQFTGRTFYGAFIEYGWTARGGKPVNGELYMKNAARSTRAQVLRDYKQHIKSGIVKLTR